MMIFTSLEERVSTGFHPTFAISAFSRSPIADFHSLLSSRLWHHCKKMVRASIFEMNILTRLIPLTYAPGISFIYDMSLSRVRFRHTYLLIGMIVDENLFEQNSVISPCFR